MANKIFTSESWDGFSTGIANLKTKINNIINGTQVVSKATSATSATYATTATKAESANTATSATYATTATSAGTANKLGTATVGSATKPIYLNAGVATTCTTYAGGTKVTLNGSAKGGADASFFAPTTGGTSGQVLKSAGTASAPVWGSLGASDVNAYTKTEVDTKLSEKSDTTHNHDSKYDAKGASTAALESAKTYTNTKVKGMATTATVDSKISTHNASSAAHNDIRNLISGLTTRLNTLADSVITGIVKIENKSNANENLLLQYNQISTYEKNGTITRIKLTDGKCYLQYYLNNSTYVGQVLLGEIKH